MVNPHQPFGIRCASHDGHLRSFILAGFALVASLLLPAHFLSASPDRATNGVRPADAGDPLPQQAFLPAIINDIPHLFDMTLFMVNDEMRLYEVQHSNGSQARHQTQTAGGRFYHTKGDEIRAEWEELWATESAIYRGTDTSPGNDQYYTLYEGSTAGSAWSPRRWHVGDLYERNPYVVFYRKSDCAVVASGYQRSWLRFEAYYPSYTFASGITLESVVVLTWLLSLDAQPIESYFYAQGYGLVGWGSSDRGYSFVSWLHEPGQRPDNRREVIPCLGSVDGRLRFVPELRFGPLPGSFRAK